MFKVKSTNKAFIKGRGKVFYCLSPVTCSRLSGQASKAIGPQIEIDGRVYPVKGIEMRMPGRPLEIDEPIGILVGFVKREAA